MNTVFAIAGIAVGSKVITTMLEESGKGKFSFFVDIAAWLACGYLVFTEFDGAMDFVKTTFYYKSW